MARNLTMRVMGWGGSGATIFPPSEVTNYEVVTYEVDGLPNGDEAQIGRRPSNRWQIRRFKDGAVQGDWTGDYQSEHEALEALQKEYDC